MKNYKYIYFIGIGGIGMSAIARYYNFKGYKVSGYDKTPSEITQDLEKEGIEIHFEDRPDLIPANIEETLVVYTPAIPASLKELITVKEKGYRVIKRSKMLGEITEGQKCLAVAGTHGKTSTSTLISHIMTDSKEGCSAFIGGISKNYNTNMLASHTPTVTVEADEFDRSFLQLHPSIAVITSMEADHLDIYGNIENIKEAFRSFASQVKEQIIVKEEIKADFSKKALAENNLELKASLFSYSIDNNDSDFYATNAKPSKTGYFTYDLHFPIEFASKVLGSTFNEAVLKDVKVGMPGWVNMENSIAAASVAICYGIEGSKIKKALESWKGVKRRTDIHLNTPTCSYIDDYAHHPKELSTAISSMRDMFPNRKLTAIFQPHLYSRTQDFAKEFAESLSKADKVILLDIYPAREEPIPGVTSKLIFDQITNENKVLIKKEELLDFLENEDLDVLATFGAGNIDRLIQPITELVKKKAFNKIFQNSFAGKLAKKLPKELKKESNKKKFK